MSKSSPVRKKTGHSISPRTKTKSGLLQTPIIRVLLAISLCQTAGIMGSFFTAPAIDGWYATLNKPWFNPPNWLFGLVWLTLYSLMGISLYLVWSVGIKKTLVRQAVIIFLLHLTVNAVWSIIFFGWRDTLVSLFIIGLLWGLILILIRRFYQLKKAAAYLLIPYLAWVSLAMALNFEIWRLN